MTLCILNALRRDSRLYKYHIKEYGAPKVTSATLSCISFCKVIFHNYLEIVFRFYVKVTYYFVITKYHM